jgi:hypothetical protein
MEKQSLKDQSLKDQSLKDKSLKGQSLKDQILKDSSVDDLSKQLEDISLNKKSSISKKEYVKKERLPIYIGVNIDNKIIKDVFKDVFKDIFKDKSILDDKSIKDEFHVTLVFKPKKEQKDQISCEGTSCKVYLEGFGYSPDAVAIKVEKILRDSGEDVPCFLKEDGILHITVALAEGIKPANSYLAITNGTYEKFKKIIYIEGSIKYY